MKTLIEIVAKIHENEEKEKQQNYANKLAQVAQETAKLERETRENLHKLLPLLSREGVELKMVLLNPEKPEYGSKPMLVKGNRAMPIDANFSRTIRDHLTIDKDGDVCANYFTRQCFLNLYKELYEEDNAPKMSDES
jgi:hypothetical protein